MVTGLNGAGTSITASCRIKVRIRTVSFNFLPFVPLETVPQSDKSSIFNMLDPRWGYVVAFPWFLGISASPHQC